jgi:hypothetical protein
LVPPPEGVNPTEGKLDHISTFRDPHAQYYEITELLVLVQFKHQYRNPVDPSYFSHPIIDTVAFGVLKKTCSRHENCLNTV